MRDRGRTAQSSATVPTAATSARMRRVRHAGTAPELAVRKILRGLGEKFSINSAAAIGRPDLCSEKGKWAIFVHGCFWHRHASCPKSSVPKTNAAFWKAKFDTNRRRDAKKVRQLRHLGWGVLTIWQCELVTPQKASVRIRAWLARRSRKTSSVPKIRV